MPNTTAIIAALIALLVGGSGLWGYHEHEGKLQAQQQVVAVTAQLALCKAQADAQNVAVNDMEQRAQAAQAAASKAEKVAQASARAAEQEHQRVLALSKQPETTKSCDSAWGAIEARGVGG